MLQIHDHSVSEYTDDIRMQNAGREQIQDIFSIFRDDGVSGIIAALIADDNIRLLCGEVDDPSFSFIAPVDSGNSS